MLYKHPILKFNRLSNFTIFTAYSPSSIAEYALSSILALSKNIQKSYELTKEADFTIGGLQCILLEDKVAGVIGTGLIGKKTVQKLSGLFKKVNKRI